MVRPSGDHCGFEHRAPPVLVTWRGLVPSALAIQSSSEPERVDAKTMRVPSGE
jgi:hypothetical protein